MSFVHTRGRDIVDGAGRPLLLRGVGLGNWLLPEGYMWKFGEGLNSPREIERAHRAPDRRRGRHRLLETVPGRLHRRGRHRPDRRTRLRPRPPADQLTRGAHRRRRVPGGRLRPDRPRGRVVQAARPVDPARPARRARRPDRHQHRRLPNSQPELFMDDEYRAADRRCSGGSSPGATATRPPCSATTCSTSRCRTSGSTSTRTSSSRSTRSSPPRSARSTRTT